LRWRTRILRQPQWKALLLQGAAGVFGSEGRLQWADVDLKVLHVKIGELTLENDFLESALGKASMPGAT
jgi:transposase